MTISNAKASSATATDALNTAFSKTLTADQAAITAALSRDKYQAAYDNYQSQINPLEQQRLITLGDGADRDGAALALAMASAADADVGIANAYLADAATSLAAKQGRQITQLYLTLLNRAPSLSEVRFWSGKLNQGTTTAQLAKSLLESKDGLLLYPANLSNDDFVTRLFK
ncbi:MAG: DUF4214 domain-containing protein, partial [Pseudomonadota bacterium]